MKPTRQTLLAGLIAIAVIALVLAFLLNRGEHPARVEGRERDRATASSATGKSGGDAGGTSTESAGEFEGARGIVRGSFAHERGDIVLYCGNALVLAKNLEAGPFTISYSPKPDTPYRVAFSARGFRARTYLLPKPVEDLGDVRLLQGPGYGGRLVSEAGGPVAGLIVEMRNRGRRLLGQSSPSDHDGRFRIDLDIPPPMMAMHPGSNFMANCQLQIRDGGQYVGAVVAQPSGLAHSHEIQVPQWEEPPRIRVVSDGAPQANVVVTLHAMPGPRDLDFGPTASRVVTDERGEADLLWPADFPMILIALRPEGSAAPTLVAATSRDLSLPVHEIDLQNARTITTRVVWADDGAAVADAAVTLTGSLAGTRDRMVFMGTTGPDGNFRSAAVPFVNTDDAKFELQSWATRYRRDGALRVEVHEAHGQNLFGPKLPPLKVGAKLETPRPGVWMTLRGAGGRPQVPERVLLWLFEGNKAVHHVEFRVSDVPVDGAWFLSPYRSPLRFLDQQLDTAVFCITASGRHWASISLPFNRVRETWGAERALSLELPAQGAEARIQVLTPDGQAAAHALVRVLPDEPRPYERNSVIRLAADDEGKAVIGDLDRDRTYSVFAIDAASGAMAIRRNTRADGSTASIQLLEPRVVEFDVSFGPDEPAVRPRAASVRGWARLKPEGLHHAMAGRWLPSGKLKFPRMVPELFEFDIQAFDRQHAESHRMASSTHRKILSGARLPREGAVTLELIELK